MTDNPSVVWHVTMSLDGFIAGPGHRMEVLLGHADGGANRLGEAVREATGAIVAGRNWYDTATAHYDGRHGIYGGKWSGPVFVLTHRDTPPEPDITFLSGDIEQAIATAAAAAEGRPVELFGADVARQALEAGVLDDIVVHIAPVLLGDGIRLYGAPGQRPVELERVDLESAGQLTGVRYRVTG